MKIYFYKNASFKPTDVQIYDCNGVVEFFDKNHINPDEYVICDKQGNEHNYDYDLHDDIYIIFPKIAKGSSGKGWLGVVLGIVTIFTAGATAGLLGLTLNGARMLGVGMLLSGAGTLIMGQQKLPSMDINTDSATKQNYQWNVGNLSTNRGVKGVTFGSDVVPEGELLAYRTYGTSSISGGTSSNRYYYGNKQLKDKAEYDKYYKQVTSYQRGLMRIETTHTDAYANDDGTSWLEMLIGCGEGELDSISDIKVNDTPIENIEDANYEVRLGSNNQSAFPQTNLDNQVGIMSVGQTMPQKLSGSDNPLVITTSHACDSALIACQTNVLYNMDTQSGAKNRCYLKPKIGYRLSGSTGAYTYVKTGINEIDNDLPLKAESAFYFNVAIKFPINGIYEISLQNCSAEKCVEKGLLGSLPTVLPDRLQCAISIDNIALYDNIEQTFPGTALIYLRLPASQALSGSMPKVTWKQSRNNTYVWNGTTYVAKPLNNLAWAIYDILAQVKKDGNTYHNEGEDVANIDYDKFADFADFCDDLGLKGNWFLNKLDTAWSTAMSVATSARAFIGTRNGRIAPFWDCATEMTQIFTVGNYESLSGAVNAKKDRARAIEATFNDEDDNYLSKTIRVEVDDFAADADAVGVTYVGLTNVDAVYKAAHYQLRKNKYLCQTVKFTANLDALVCELNDVIGVQCDITKYGVGGRIFAVNGNSISLDAPVTLNGGNYALLVAHDNGDIDRMEVVEHSGTLTTVTVSGYTRAPKANEVYSFGVVDEEVKKYRVTSIVKTSDLKCEIEAVEYQPFVYREGVAPDISYTNPNANISNIAVTYNPEGVDIAWHKDVNTAYVDVYVDGVYYGRFAEGATIPNVNSTQEIECVPVNAYGEEGTSVVRAISNSIPAPSQPPIPIVQALPTGAVVQFQIPQNQYITWIIIKEGDDELGRSIVAGDEVTLNLNLEGGTHHLTAYFLNSYGKTSIGRDFDATPFGIDSNMLSNGFLMKPQGSILRLSAKGCTTDSIKSANGVKDVSGYNHHGQAYGGVTVLDGGEGFGFDGTANAHIDISNNGYSFDNHTLTYSVKIKFNGNTSTSSQLQIILGRQMFELDYNYASDHKVYYSIYNSSNTRKGKWTDNAINELLDGKAHLLTVTYDKTNLILYLDGMEKERMALTDDFTSQRGLYVGGNGTVDYSLNANIYDVRIYPRALSATEVKSMYMLPDEAIFGQLNADLIGANAINAVHLNAGSVTANAVASNEIIANGANIRDGVITNAKISNLDAAKITSGTIAAARIEAESITAEKLNVAALKAPSGCICYINAQGMAAGVYSSGIVADSSGHQKKANINGSVQIYDQNTSAPAFFTWKNGQQGSLWTEQEVWGKQYLTFEVWFFPVNYTDTSNHAIVSNYPNALRTSGICLYQNKLKVRAYIKDQYGPYECDVSLTATALTHVVLEYNAESGSLTWFVNGVQRNTITDELLKQTMSTANANIVINAPVYNNYYAQNEIVSVRVYKRNLTSTEVKTLYMLGTDTESGQITADRIATSAIKSRNWVAGQDETGTNFTTGTFLNLQTGTINSPNMCVNASVAKFKGEVTATSGSFTGTVTATGGKIGDWNIVSNNLSMTANSLNRAGIKMTYTDSSTRVRNDNEMQAYQQMLTQYDSAGVATDFTYVTPGYVNISNYRMSSSVALRVSGKVEVNGSVVHGSDRNIKSDIKQTSTLNKLKQLSVYSWKYDDDKLALREYNRKIEKGENAEKPKLGTGAKNSAMQIGPMAQDFNAMFGTNNGSEDYISYTDTIGVALRAIQELATQLDDLKRDVRLYKRILNISQEQINAERDNRANRLLAIAQARQAKREVVADENTDTLDNNTNSDGLR